ncbi:hypothetical protein IFM89_033955 [Coptis chinensis]|uniref:Uncharacterized protein n=1 Tax=Coptis chinensis TaxID=261450 RepID=A0A835HZN6_9MAGN|nr:hypothetical protein IFM89_033955 [Coptis chinensis]
MITKRKFLRLNGLGQPSKPKKDVDFFITKLGHIARRDIPIRFENWKEVHLDKNDKCIVAKAVEALGKMFAFEHLSSIDIDWTRNKFRLAWKEYKHELYNKYVKDQPPSIVKENPQDGIPLQDWRRFVDNCHSEKFKNTQQCHSFTHSFSRRRRVLDLSPTASFILGWTSLLIQRLHASSLRNSANRKNQKNSSCLGRKSAAVAREEMAMAKGVPESSIGRVESYKFIHKRKSGVAQDPELVVSSWADSSRGRFRGLGEGVCKTTLKKMKPVMQQNIALMEKNTSLEKKVDVLQASILENTAVLKAFMSQGRTSMPDVSSPCSSHARYTPSTPVLNEFIGKECDLCGGWPLSKLWLGVLCKMLILLLSLVIGD